MFFRDLIRKKKLLKQSVEDLFTTSRLPLDSGTFPSGTKMRGGNVSPLHDHHPVWTVNCTQPRRCPTGKQSTSKLCTDVSNKGMLKTSACSNFIPTVPVLAPSSVPVTSSSLRPTCSSLGLRDCRHQQPTSYTTLSPSALI